MSDPAAKHIIVIDDEPTMVRACQRYLRDYRVTSFSDRIREQLDAIAGAAPDLVLLDLFLAGINGGEVIAQLRERGLRAPILLMSGSFEAHRGADQFSFGADDVIAKPFTRDALVVKIERLLTAHELAVRAAAQHAELVALHERRDVEHEAARTLLGRMLSRGEFDSCKTRHDVVVCGDFGGDLVLGARVGPDRFRWMVGDVTGHTLASALVTIPLSMLFYGTARDGVPLSDALPALERELAAMLPVTMFCAAAIGELDRSDGTLRIWNGGAPPVVVRRGDGRIDTFESEDPPLSVDRRRTIPHVIHTTRVSPGDRIYTFSDGLTEARSVCGAFLGIERITEALSGSSPEEAYDALWELWRVHMRSSVMSDDTSVLEVSV